MMISRVGGILAHRVEIIRIASSCCLHGLPPKKEYVDIARYPEIPPIVSETEMETNNLVQTVKDLRTVEEKLFYLNKPKYYGWYTNVMRLEAVPYGTRDYVASATYTHVVDGLPEIYETLDVDQLAEKVRPSLERILLKDEDNFEAENQVANDRICYLEEHAKPTYTNPMRKDELKIKRLVGQIDRAIQMHLGQELSHLWEGQVDFGTRSEAFWFRGGFNPDKLMIQKKKGTQKLLKKKPYFRKGGTLTDEYVYRQYDRALQISGKALVKRRSDVSLPDFVDFNDKLCHKGQEEEGEAIPKYPYNPTYTGFPSYCQNGTNMPGYWATSEKRFTSLQIVSNVNQLEKEYKIAKPQYCDRENMLLSKALMASFAVALPEACYLGYSPLYDPPHPMTTQTMVTDGEKWKLSAFQLNKTALFPNDTKGWKNNIIWHLPEFDLVDRENNLINMESLKQILKFYTLKPSQERYSDVEFAHNVKDDYNRQYFVNTYWHMYSNRPRHRPKPEIQPYQRLYMIDHKNMMFHMGWRERPWFVMAKYCFKGREHWHPEFKHYDHYTPAYQPKVFRKHRTWEHNVKKVTVPLPKD